MTTFQENVVIQERKERFKQLTVAKFKNETVNCRVLLRKVGNQHSLMNVYILYKPTVFVKETTVFVQKKAVHG